MIRPVLSPRDRLTDPLKLAGEAISSGLKAIELLASPDLSTQTAGKVLQLGVEIACLASAEPLSEHLLSDLIDQANHLDIPSLLVPLSSPDRPYRQAYDQLYDLLYPIAPELDQLSLRLLLCAPQPAFLLSPLELRSLIDAINSPNVGCCLDSSLLLAHGLHLQDWLIALDARVFAYRPGSRNTFPAESTQPLQAACRLLSRIPDQVLWLTSDPAILPQAASDR